MRFAGLKPAECSIDVKPIPDFNNTVGMRLILIQKGYFEMGSSPNETKNDKYDTRFFEVKHLEKIVCPIYIGATEVTNLQFDQFVKSTNYQGGEDSIDFRANNTVERWQSHRGPNKPATFISWYDARAFCRWLTAKENKFYRLPMESEWEYACRAGSSQAYCFGDDNSLLGEYAWYNPNSFYKPQMVGLKKPNAWGLYDMHGNVWELCEDSPPDAAAQELQQSGYKIKTTAAIRGGNYGNGAASCRCAKRSWNPVTKRDPGTGFRVVYDPNVNVNEEQ